MSKERYPGATLDLLPEAGAPDGHRKTQLIYHSTGTMAGAAANLRYFARPDITVESTFIVGLDGECLQAMWASDKADANKSASTRAMSVEVVNDGERPWTAAQVARCIDIAVWAHREHGIPLAQIPAHDQSGVGWHVMFGAPGPWTGVPGKVCPGKHAIRQVRGDVLPGARRLALTQTEEDDLTPDQLAELIRTNPKVNSAVRQAAADMLIEAGDPQDRADRSIARVLRRIFSGG